MGTPPHLYKVYVEVQVRRLVKKIRPIIEQGSRVSVLIGEWIQEEGSGFGNRFTKCLSSAKTSESVGSLQLIIEIAYKKNFIWHMKRCKHFWSISTVMNLLSHTVADLWKRISSDGSQCCESGWRHLCWVGWGHWGNRRARMVWCKVAELGSLSSGAKMAMKIFVKRVFTIFATNAFFCA